MRNASQRKRYAGRINDGAVADAIQLGITTIPGIAVALRRERGQVRNEIERLIERGVIVLRRPDRGRIPAVYALNQTAPQPADEG